MRSINKLRIPLRKYESYALIHEIFALYHDSYALIRESFASYHESYA